MTSTALCGAVPFFPAKPERFSSYFCPILPFVPFYAPYFLAFVLLALLLFSYNVGFSLLLFFYALLYNPHRFAIKPTPILCLGGLFYFFMELRAGRR